MLSVIVCSINSKRYKALQQNIRSTIGNIKYEIIRIDNNLFQLDIAEAYNHGISMSKYPFLLFFHEDIKIHTYHWGKILCSIFHFNEELGLIGIAGSKIKTNTSTSWWESEPETWVMHLIQHYSNGQVEDIQRGFKNDLEEVVVIDGVFMAMRKLEGIKFDERLKGFHNYDQSISMRYRSLGYKVYVTKEILIEHFSIGKKGEDLYASNLELQRLYKKDLPQSLNDNKITRRQKAFAYLRMYRNIKNKASFTAYIFLLKYFYYRPFSRENKIIIKEFLGI